MSDDLSELRRDVDDLTAQVSMLSQDVADLGALSLAAPSAGAARSYSSVEEWVEEYFRPTFQRPLGGEYRWCVTWAEHPEAVLRMTALWTSWEAMHADRSTGMASWLVNYLDPQMSIVMGRVGPFAGCTSQRHQP